MKKLGRRTMREKVEAMDRIHSRENGSPVGVAPGDLMAAKMFEMAYKVTGRVKGR